MPSPADSGRYVPFALKYRPRTFQDVVGQGAVAATLKSSVATSRVPNAFLFCGSRGVGKTSMARILAKALNCDQSSEGEPCGTCEVCTSIATGEDMDVIEVDGASNRGIDEIRTIRDNVAYTPSRSRFKVYIIDEVHMLTMAAFNALLKTLEEPPPHVKFIFATTEAHAVPETIVSRCQKHEFKRISVDDIVSRLRFISEQEGMTVEDGVLGEIAHRAEGGLRDSLSLLDQLMAFAGSEPDVSDLDRILGRIDSAILGGLAQGIGQGDEGLVLDQLDQAFESGRDATDVLDQMCELYRAAMVREARGLPGGGEGVRADLVEQLRADFSLDRLMLALRLCLNARREIKIGGLARYQVELTFLKIARSTDLLPLRELLDSLRVGGAMPAPNAQGGDQKPSFRRTLPTRKAKASAPPASAPAAAEAPAEPRPPVREAEPRRPAPAPEAEPDAQLQEQAAPKPRPAVPPTREAPTLPIVQAEWSKVVQEVRAQKPRAASLVEQARPQGLQGHKLELLLPPGWTFQKKQLEGQFKTLIRDAIASVFGVALVPSYKAPDRSASKELPLERQAVNDPNVRKLLDSFGGQVVNVRGPKKPDPQELAELEECEDEGV